MVRRHHRADLAIARSLHVQARHPGASAAAAPGQRSTRFRCTRRSTSAADAPAVRDAWQSCSARAAGAFASAIFGGVEWSFADKHNWARRGVLVAHAGFVIIAAGTTLYWARGFSGEIAVLTGQTAQVAQTRALIRLDDFAYKIAPIMTKSGMVYQPIDYVSHVTVTGNDGVHETMTVRVNHPIDVDGTLYYQASYGFGMRFCVDALWTARCRALDRTLLEGDSFDLPGTQRSVLYERFAPTVDRQSGMPTADPRVNNPAVVLGVSQAGNTLGEALVPLGTLDRSRRRLARRTRALRALQRLSVPLRSGRSAGRNRRVRAARGADHFVLLPAGAALSARRPDRTRAAPASASPRRRSRDTTFSPTSSHASLRPCAGNWGPRRR